MDQATKNQLEKAPERIVSGFNDDLTPTIKWPKNDFLYEHIEKVRSAITNELNTHYALALGIDDDYKDLARKTCKDLIEEYQCQTPSEIMLAEVATGAYIRYLLYSKTLNVWASMLPYDKVVNNTFALLSKEVSRAERTLISTLATLKQFKAPRIEVNLNTTNAYIANQQVNNPDQKHYEINERQ